MTEASMGRPVVLSNGKLFVALNEDGLVHDFYYPYVGLENLTTARSISHKIGVWIDGQFRWTDDGSWQITVDFETEALISRVTMHSPELQVSLMFKDFVDQEHTAFIRHIDVINHDSRERDMRVFMHQVFEISRDGRADTALYVPEGHHLLNYKGRKCLLISGVLDGREDFDQFAVGNYEVEGKSGTFKDAEDGELSNNLVEHGGVDSVIRFRKQVPAGGSFTIDYWIAVASSHEEAFDIHREIKGSSMESRQDDTRSKFYEWLQPSLERIEHVPEPYRTAVKKSLLTMKAHCDNHGSILASGDSSIFNYGRDYYCYCWPRDAVYTLWPMIRLGLYDEAKKFFDFARGTIHRDGYMLHKYQADRAIGSTWHAQMQNGVPELAIQEDETGCIVFMLWEYYEATQDRELLEQYYETLVLPAASFMVNFVDEATGLPHASFDLWEEKFLTSTYTVSMTIAGLHAAAKIAHLLGNLQDAEAWQRSADKIREKLDALFHPDGYFRKGLALLPNGDLRYDDVIDISSLQGIYMLAGLSQEDMRLQGTVRRIEERLLNSSPIGGVIRYENDNYFRHNRDYPGNPWIVCTMWLAQYYAGIGDKQKALQFVDWALDRMTTSGMLGEQFDPVTGQCLGVMPLVWSHAELVNTILDVHGI